MHYVKHFKINGVDTRQVACIELHGAPNAATAAAVGALGIDVDSPTHEAYKCVAVNGSIYTWELLSSGLSIMNATISGKGADSVQFPYANLLTPAMYMLKKGDLILDREGYLYQIDAINTTYCVAKYTGSQFTARVANGVHVGASAPTQGELLWLDTDDYPDESGEGEGNVGDSPIVDVIAKAGQVIAVKAVDEDGKPLEYHGVDLPKVPEIPKAVTPDFAANEGEDGYIKNRTHYVDEKGVIHKLPNKFIDADWMATSRENIDDSVIIPEQAVTNMWKNRQMDIQPGITYDVHINDVVYPCVAHNNDDGIYLGNNTSLTLNDLPFCIFWAGGSATAGFFYKNSTVLSGSIYMKVTGHSWTDYNKLPKEFLPGCVVKTVNGATPDEKGNVNVQGSFYVDISTGNGYSCSTKISTLDALLDTGCSIVAKITTDTGALFAPLCSYETSADNSYGRVVMFALGMVTFTLTPASSDSYEVTVSGD